MFVWGVRFSFHPPKFAGRLALSQEVTAVYLSRKGSLWARAEAVSTALNSQGFDQRSTSMGVSRFEHGRVHQKFGCTSVWELGRSVKSASVMEQEVRFLIHPPQAQSQIAGCFPRKEETGGASPPCLTNRD